MKILFICTGNTCRSPMAEALVRHKAPDVEVQSAGLFASENQRINQHAMDVLKDRAISLDHSSQPVTNELLNWANLVLTMTTQHKQSLILHYPNYQEKYFTLKEYVSETDKKIWDELKQAYANYEEKRSLFIQENELKLDNARLDEAIATRFQEDIARIRQLEANIISYDISDPFGGELRIYQDTLNELDEYTSKLVTKIKN